MTLRVLDHVLDALLDVRVRGVAEVLPGLTLIHLKAQRRLLVRLRQKNASGEGLAAVESTAKERASPAR